MPRDPKHTDQPFSVDKYSHDFNNEILSSQLDDLQIDKSNNLVDDNKERDIVCKNHHHKNIDNFQEQIDELGYSGASWTKGNIGEEKVEISHASKCSSDENTSRRNTSNSCSDASSNIDFVFCNGHTMELVDEIIESSRIAIDYIHDTSVQPISSGENSTSVIEKSNKADDISFCSPDVIDQIKQTSVKDMRTQHTIGESGNTRGAVFESFRNLDEPIRQAIQNSLDDVGGDHLDTLEESLDRRSVMQKTKTASWTELGCNSELSYRNVKMALQASLDDVQIVGKEIGSHIDKRDKRRSILDDMLDEGAVAEDVTSRYAEVVDVKIADSVNHDEISHCMNDLSDRRAASWKKHGCTSEQSYRILKQVMNASLDDVSYSNDRVRRVSDTEKRGEKCSIWDDMLVEEALESTDDKNILEATSNDRRDSWAKHGCDSAKSYQNLKQAMEASIQDLDVEIAQCLAAKYDEPVCRSMRSEKKEYKPEIAPSIELTSKKGCERKVAMDASMNEIGGISKSLRDDLSGVNDKTFQQITHTYKGHDDALTYMVGDEKRDSVKSEQYDVLLKYDNKDGVSQKNHSSTNNKTATMFFRKKALTTQNLETADDNQDKKLIENYAEEAQLRKLNAFHQDPLLIMDSFNDAKKDKKKKKKDGSQRRNPAHQTKSNYTP